MRHEIVPARTRTRHWSLGRSLGLSSVRGSRLSSAYTVFSRAGPRVWASLRLDTLEVERERLRCVSSVSVSRVRSLVLFTRRSVDDLTLETRKLENKNVTP